MTGLARDGVWALLGGRGEMSTTERGRYGPKLMEGQILSGKYPGMIACGNGVFRRPSVWRDKAGRDRSTNYYYVESICANCCGGMLAERGNAKRTRTFCSADCRRAKRRSESSGRIGIRKREHGTGHHVLVKTYDHPRSGRHNRVYEHTLVAEEKIGRPIMDGERVHHINLVKSDNRPHNLFVCANNTEHLKIHGSLNACVAALMEMGVLTFNAESKTYQVKK